MFASIKRAAYTSGLLSIWVALLQPFYLFGADNHYSIGLIKSGAQSAQEHCYMKIHFDTFEYLDCIDDLTKNFSAESSQKLGMYYFGYVGAMDSVRTGMYGATNTAWVFLKKFRKIQKELRVSDSELCESVPGDCQTRLAQIKLMDKMPRPKPLDPEGATPSGSHVGH